MTSTRGDLPSLIHRLNFCGAKRALYGGGCHGQRAIATVVDPPDQNRLDQLTPVHYVTEQMVEQLLQFGATAGCCLA